MGPYSSVGSSRLLCLLICLLAVSVHGRPTLDTGFLGGVKRSSHNANALLQTGLTTLTSLLAALKSGQTVQNGLWGLVNINNITTNAGSSANGATSNYISEILPPASSEEETKPCPDVAVLFARGTLEPGNMGFVVGPPLATALMHYANTSRLAVQGLGYAASIEGFRDGGGSSAGARTLALLANATRDACPQARLVMAGYSQGAQVVRKACALLGNATAGDLTAVVLFGDPRNGTAVPGVEPGRVFTACHAGDRVCQGGSAVLPAHLNYSADVPAAAAFVMQRTGLGMGGRDAVDQGMGDIPMMNSTAAAAAPGEQQPPLGDLGSAGDVPGAAGSGQGSKRLGMLMGLG